MSDVVRKKSQLEWRYDLNSCLEGLRESNKNLQPDCFMLGGGLNLISPMHNARVLNARPAHSVLSCRK
jgi:hypothetical protein